MRFLTIGGISISVESSDRISQTYEPMGGVATLRTMAGGAIRQRNWRKLKTTISVSEARLLPALQGLDMDAPQVIQCIAARHIAGASNVIALPAARRADVAPGGYAVLPNGTMLRTPGVLVGSTLTLTPVVGALSYTASYVPELTVLITGLTEHADVRAGVVGWDLTAEEI